MKREKKTPRRWHTTQSRLSQSKQNDIAFFAVVAFRFLLLVPFVIAADCKNIFSVLISVGSFGALGMGFVAVVVVHSSSFLNYFTQLYQERSSYLV